MATKDSSIQFETKDVAELQSRIDVRPSLNVLAMADLDTTESQSETTSVQFLEVPRQQLRKRAKQQNILTIEKRRKIGCLVDEPDPRRNETYASRHPAFVLCFNPLWLLWLIQAASVSELQPKSTEVSHFIRLTRNERKGKSSDAFCGFGLSRLRHYALGWPPTAIQHISWSVAI